MKVSIPDIGKIGKLFPKRFREEEILE